MLAELLPPEVRRVLDVGCGDGRLIDLVRERAARTRGVGVDFRRRCWRGARATPRQRTAVEHNLLTRSRTGHVRH